MMNRLIRTIYLHFQLSFSVSLLVKEKTFYLISLLNVLLILSAIINKDEANPQNPTPPSPKSLPIIFLHNLTNSNDVTNSIPDYEESKYG